MDFMSGIREALSNLFASKLRSLLALLGVVVGTASVVAMVSCGELATNQALKQFESLGMDLLSVSFYAGDSESRTSQTLHLSFGVLQEIKNLSPAILGVSPYGTAYSPLSFEGKALKGNIIGASEVLQRVINIKLQRGRFISDLDNYAHYCVLGSLLAEQLNQFVESDLIGLQISLGNHIFTVMGVAQTWPESAFFNEDVNQSVIIPHKTLEFLEKESSINNLVMILKKGTEVDSIEAVVSYFLESKVKNLNVFFRSAKQLVRSMQAQSRIFTLMLGLIGSISLLVGGIGIMNIMLVSVTERRKEIGIRMACGASRRDIQSLFLIESVMLSLLGGVVGVFLGMVTSYVIAKLTHWDFVILMTPSGVGFIVSVMVGVFFGFYPAYKASRLDPIQTLRSE